MNDLNALLAAQQWPVLCEQMLAYIQTGRIDTPFLQIVLQGTWNGPLTSKLYSALHAWRGRCGAANADLEYTLGRLALHQGELSGYAQEHLRAAADKSTHPKYAYTLASHLQNAGEFIQVVEILEETRQRYGFDPSQLSLYATALSNARQFGQAQLMFDAAYRSNGGSLPSLDCYYGYHLMRQGKWKQGWQRFEGRVAVGDTYAYQVPAAHWKGEALQGKSIVVFTQWGFGDQIMFSALLPQLLQEADKVLMVAYPPNVSLLRATFPKLRVAPAYVKLIAERAGGTELPPDLPYRDEILQADYQVALLSLPALYNLDESGLYIGRYLEPNRDKVAQKAAWLDSICPRQPGRLRIALALNPTPPSGDWARDNVNGKRAIPSKFLHLLDLPNIDWFFVQDRQHTYALREASLTVVDCGPAIQEFEDTAALVENMDFVIAADCAVSHVSAALGKPTWVLCPYFTDWRWGSSSQSMYYQHARVIRQTTPGDWTSALNAARQDISLYRMGHDLCHA